jgi:hypothetical protein
MMLSERARAAADTFRNEMGDDFTFSKSKSKRGSLYVQHEHGWLFMWGNLYLQPEQGAMGGDDTFITINGGCCCFQPDKCGMQMLSVRSIWNADTFSKCKGRC